MKTTKTSEEKFGQLPADILKQIFKYITQNGTISPSSHIRKQFKSPGPALNFHHHNEADATNQIFSDTPATNRGETSVHIFVGKD